MVIMKNPIHAEKTKLTDEQYRVQARKDYATDGYVEIDVGAVVSRGDEPGAYVRAWVWVYDEDVT